MATFKRPVNVTKARDLFSDREVGLNHPDNNAYIKLGSNGSIEIMVGPELGIVIDSYSRGIHIFGDAVYFHTKETDGIRWNRLSFNHRATKYTEPPLIEHDLSDLAGLFDGIDEILGD